MLSIFGILFFLPQLLALQSVDLYTKFSQLDLPPGASGPFPVSLDSFRQGPYVGVNDGRILKYNGSVFVDFAYTSPNRTKQLCDGVTDINLGPTCGRPLGFCFDPLTRFLYIVDAYHGLYKVGPKGGLATFLTNNASGKPFNFLNGIDFDSFRRVVYITDTSLRFNYSFVLQGGFLLNGDSTGRLLEYDTKTEKVRVLLEGLPLPTGPAVNSLGTYLLYSSFNARKIYRYWLGNPIFPGLIPQRWPEPEGVLEDIPGNPITIKRAPEPETFWVAVNFFPVDQNQQPRDGPIPSGYKFNVKGEILVVKNLTAQFANKLVNLLQEYNGGVLYVGSRQASSLGIYKKKWRTTN